MVQLSLLFPPATVMYEAYDKSTSICGAWDTQSNMTQYKGKAHVTLCNPILTPDLIAGPVLQPRHTAASGTEFCSCLGTFGCCCKVCAR